MKHILLVEDNEDDIFLIRRACDCSGFEHSIHVTRDGEEAVKYLSGLDEFSDRDRYPLPHLVFLDINMPKMCGYAVVQWMRFKPHFADLPVVMVTTSEELNDMQRAYSLGVNTYLGKDRDLVTFSQNIRQVLKYWLESNESYHLYHKNYLIPRARPGGLVAA